MVDLPKFHECMTPLLEVLRDHGELDRHTAADLVVRHMGLTPEQIALSHETSGKSVIKGRIGWASSALKSCGALIQPKRAHWASGHNAEKLLSLGRPAKLSDIRKFEEYKQHKIRKLEARVGVTSDDDLDSADSTPEDLIEKGINALKSSLIEELLENPLLTLSGISLTFNSDRSTRRISHAPRRRPPLPGGRDGLARSLVHL